MDPAAGLPQNKNPQPKTQTPAPQSSKFGWLKTKKGLIVLASVFIFTGSVGAIAVSSRAKPAPKPVQTNQPAKSSDSSMGDMVMPPPAPVPAPPSPSPAKKTSPSPAPSPAPTPTSPPAAAPQTWSVDISGFAFSSASLSIKKGDTVIWTNKDSASHTVTSDDGSFTSSGTLGNGVTYQYTFNSAGTFTYHCAFHSSMTATITVT